MFKITSGEIEELLVEELLYLVDRAGQDFSEGAKWLENKLPMLVDTLTPAKKKGEFVVYEAGEEFPFQFTDLVSLYETALYLVGCGHYDEETNSSERYEIETGEDAEDAFNNMKCYQKVVDKLWEEMQEDVC